MTFGFSPGVSVCDAEAVLTAVLDPAAAGRVLVDFPFPLLEAEAEAEDRRW